MTKDVRTTIRIWKMIDIIMRHGHRNGCERIGWQPLKKPTNAAMPPPLVSAVMLVVFVVSRVSKTVSRVSKMESRVSKTENLCWAPHEDSVSVMPYNRHSYAHSTPACSVQYADSQPQKR